MAGLTATQNYLVPASGSTHGYPVSQVFSATPFAIDFRSVELDGQPFVPSGVFVDNSAGIGDLVITVAGFNYSVVCPAGGRLQAQYPAPVDQSCTITGNGQASVVFVDFPVIPFLQETAATLGNVAIVNGGDVAQGNTADAIAAAPFANATVIALLKYLANREAVNNGYPVGATPVAQSTTTVNAVAVATLPAAVGKTTYITRISISGLSPTAIGTANTSIAGTLGGNVTIYAPLPAAAGQVGITPIQFDFNPPLPASAANTAIVATMPAFGAGSGAQNVAVQGFQI